MPSQRKIDILASLKEKTSRAKTIILTDYSGLTHKQLEDLRKSLKKLGAEFKIVKNSLLKLALKSDRHQASEVSIEGPTAVLLTYQEDLSPIKIIHEKGKELDSLKFKWGIWQKEIINKEKVIRLATLPNRQVLLSQLVSQIASPQINLVYALKGNFKRLEVIIECLRRKRRKRR